MLKTLVPLDHHGVRPRVTDDEVKAFYLRKMYCSWGCGAAYPGAANVPSFVVGINHPDVYIVDGLIHFGAFCFYNALCQRVYPEQKLAFNLGLVLENNKLRLSP